MPRNIVYNALNKQIHVETHLIFLDHVLADLGKLDDLVRNVAMHPDHAAVVLVEDTAVGLV